MARYTLVYGVRLIPEGSLNLLDDAKLTLTDGSTSREARLVGARV